MTDVHNQISFIHIIHLSIFIISSTGEYWTIIGMFNKNSILNYNSPRRLICCVSLIFSEGLEFFHNLIIILDQTNFICSLTCSKTIVIFRYFTCQSTVHFSSNVWVCSISVQPCWNIEISTVILLFIEITVRKRPKNLRYMILTNINNYIVSLEESCWIECT